MRLLGRLSFAQLLLLAALGCSDNDVDSTGTSGTSPNLGGNSGPTPMMGGGSPLGGSQGRGGSPPSGGGPAGGTGTAAFGGTTSQGGAAVPPTGGSTGLGGNPLLGGSTNLGGLPGDGGQAPTAGAAGSAVGGAASGGAALGGAPINGGGPATGGATAGASDGGAGAAGSGGTAALGGGGGASGEPPIRPDFANDDEEILYDAVRFYGAERCGDNHNWTLTNNPSGTSCHLRDGEPVDLDLSGGWHDAGDHVKVTLTIAYAAYIMVKAYDVYPGAFQDYDDPAYGGTPNGIPDVLDEARFGLDWLVKAHPDADRMVAMVADPDYDHSTFMTSPGASTNTPERGGEPRPVQMGAAADFAGLAAAALAIASRAYRSIDATLADGYLSKARTAYAYAKAHPGLSDSKLYAWTGMPYQDDLLCGATELWRATNEDGYRSDALATDAEIGAHEAVANYSQVSDFCRHSLVEGGESSALVSWQADVDNYTTLVSDDSNLSGLIYVDQWGTCRHAMAAAFSAALLYDVTVDTTYRDFARSQYAWVKGANPQQRSFIIGWGTNPPTRPHHRNAYGYEDDAGWDADTPQLSDTREFRHLLVGALVGGPNLEGYQDSVNDYVHNEVAIDYNAGLVGTAAFAVVNR